MRTYLVTGGAGFIGSNYIHYMFRKYDNEIRIINVDVLTYAGNLETLAEAMKNPQFRFVKADICDREAVDKLFEEEKPDKASGFKACFALLGKPFILLSFIGIMCHVGIDVGTNTTAPKILMERLDMTLAEAGFATSLYFIFRTAGCFLGAFILQKLSARTFFGISVLCMLVAMVGLFVFHEMTMIYVCIALIGFGNSNIFPIIFSQALLAMPQKKNELSGQMIMGLFGGTIFPLAMGVASDAIGQSGAVAVMTVGVLYLFFYMMKIKR